MEKLQALKVLDENIDKHELHLDTILVQEGGDRHTIELKNYLSANREWRKKAMELFEYLINKK